jgi:hypothetical protein
MNFVFPSKLKVITFSLMGLGLVGIISGWIMGDHGDVHQRFWSNMMINGFFFTAIALGALFFYAVAWSVQLKRIWEAMFQWLPWGLGIILLVLLVGRFGHLHHIWHWMDHDLYDVNSPKYDAIIAAKGGFFADWFYWFRTIAYVLTFLLFARFFRKQSLLEDEVGGIDIHKKLFRRSALFLVFFAVFSSTLAWDWLMSIDTHWFSTMYGWFVFSGMWVSCMIFSVILVLYLKKKGYLPHVNDSHIHDLGKWMFAISMLWSYLWFCQFMLIWYSNIPEEVQYFMTRIWTPDGGASPYRFLFFATFFVNFGLPFYILISRDAKRNPFFVTVVGMIIFVMHFVNVYLLVIPGTMGQHFHGIEWWEWLMFLGFLGLFVFVVLNALTKASLVPKNHPLLVESLNHHI